MKRWQHVPIMVIAVSLQLAGPRGAVDGVIEINQARVNAGGVTASDTAGFPVTLDQAGSYRLTGNVQANDPNATGISVTAIGVQVTLDLNGFTLQCGGLLGCSAGTGDGIATSSTTSLAVSNGTVRGWGRHGLNLSAGSRVDSIRALDNNGSGILVGDDCQVRNSYANANLMSGISTGNSCTVTANTTTGNTSNGIVTGDDATITGNTATANTASGIVGGDHSTIVGNTSNRNTADGIFGAIAVTVLDNTANDNGEDGLDVGFGSTLTRNTVRSNGLRRIFGATATTITSNTIAENGSTLPPVRRRIRSRRRRRRVSPLR
jgi:hypothetical protein